MPFHCVLPRSDKGSKIDIGVQMTYDLADIEAGFGCRQVVKHHSHLHRRDAINIFEIVRIDCWIRHAELFSRKAIEAVRSGTRENSLNMSWLFRVELHWNSRPVNWMMDNSGVR